MASFEKNKVTRSKVRQKTQKFAERLINILDKSIRLPKIKEIPFIDSIAQYIKSYSKKILRLEDRHPEKNRKRENTLGVQIQKTKEITAQTKLIIKENLEKFAKRLISRDTLRLNLQKALKSQAIASSIIGVVGVGNLTENVLEAVRRQLNQQLNYLDGLIKNIETRNLTKRELARLNVYADTAYSMSITAKRQADIDDVIFNDFDPYEIEERRVLDSAQDNCDDCIQLESLGWRPLGELPVPGLGTVCRYYCYCTLESRYIGNKEKGSGDKPETDQTTNENPVPKG